MADIPVPLQAALPKKSTEDLLDMLKRSAEYTPEALEAIRATLSGRGVTLPQEPKTEPAPLSGPGVSSPLESKPGFAPDDIDAAKKTQAWFVVAETSRGERRLCDKKQFVSTLRKDILDGSLTAASRVDVYTKLQDGKWTQATTPLPQFAKGEFKLGVLFEPVWSHAISGLKWGALIGIGLKLLDTLILLGSADFRLAFMFLVAIAVCFIPRIGVIGMVVVSLVMMRFSRANFFLMGLSAALIGSILGCLPGMAIGGIVGLSRRAALPLAKDAPPERDGLVLKTVVLPLLGAAALWALYLLVFNPWIASVLEKK